MRVENATSGFLRSFTLLIARTPEDHLHYQDPVIAFVKASPRDQSRARLGPCFVIRSEEAPSDSIAKGSFHLPQLDKGSADRGPESVQHPIAPIRTGIFARNGEFWTLGSQVATFSLRDIKGLSYIQQLLRHPDEEFHVLDLFDHTGDGRRAGNFKGGCKHIAGRRHRAAGSLAMRVKSSTRRPSENTSSESTT